ncbi:MAG: hypothetical protein ACNA71_10620 [Kiritimatiellia bacterium]
MSKGTLDAPAPGWYPAGMTFTATAVPVDEYRHAEWRGDTDGAVIDGNTFSFEVNGARKIDVIFKDRVTEYKRVPWWWLADLNPSWTTNDFEIVVQTTPVDGHTSIANAYFTGTDPYDAESRFEIAKVEIVGGRPRLSWSHAANADPNRPPVHVEFRTDLRHGDWTRIAQVDEDGDVLWSDEVSGDVPGYYRLTVDTPSP